jgi:hypothetical protein
VFWCCLTFELSRHQRRDAGPGLWRMYLATDRARWLAVGARLERGVRHQCAWPAGGGIFYAGDSASRAALRQEQSRYPASAACAKNVAWRSAPCIADHQSGLLVPTSWKCSRSATSVHCLLSSVGGCKAGRLCTAAPSHCYWGQLLRWDWSALMPEIAERMCWLLDSDSRLEPHGCGEKSFAALPPRGCSAHAARR